MKAEEIQARLARGLDAKEKTTVIQAFNFVETQNPDISDKKILEKIEVVNTLFEFSASPSIMAAEVLSLSGAHENEIREVFGKETSQIVESKKKFRQLLEKYTQFFHTNPELKKLIYFSLTKNMALLLLTIAEKFNILRKIKMAKEDEEAAKESQEIFIPLIHKLGINKVKSVAEDIVFKYFNPKRYAEIHEKIRLKKKEQAPELEKMRRVLMHKAKEEKINARIDYRAKGVYSTHMKMERTGKKLDEINDLLALRVITDSVEACYEMLGIVHSLWIPFQEEFDDYIVKPKNNKYRSLHTTVFGKNNTLVEIQIRTHEMHNDAELGAAAHWKYKGDEPSRAFDKRINWLNQIISWQAEKKQPEKNPKINFFGNSIYAFTPKGEVIELPENATVLDFAYAVHTDLGTHCTKGVVNGEKAAIENPLQNFDVIEIITSPKQSPKVSWLNIVKTDKAKTKIKQALQLKQPTKKTKSIISKKTGINPNDKRIRVAKCCKPIPGDNAIGFRTTKRKITIHRTDCPETKKFVGQKPIEINWLAPRQGKYSTEIKVLAKDRPGLLKELLEEISKHTEKILNANIRQIDGTKTLCIFEITAKNSGEIETIIKSLQEMKGVTNVSRS